MTVGAVRAVGSPHEVYMMRSDVLIIGAGPTGLWLRDAQARPEAVDVYFTSRGIRATLNKYRRRHDVWKARRVCRVAPGRLAVLPSRAAQHAGLPDITPSFSMWGPPCLSTCLRSVVSTDSQSAFLAPQSRAHPCALPAYADGPAACEQTGRVTTAILIQCCLKLGPARAVLSAPPGNVAHTGDLHES